MKRRCYVVGADWGIGSMFADINANVEIIDSIKHADFLQFTGGEDITPLLYGQTHHPKTYNNMMRCKKEIVVFNLARELGKPMAGICRGGQLLNVLCGGDMYQHVDNHGSGNHLVHDDITGDEYLSNSLHHQMMVVGGRGHLIAWAQQSKNRYKHVAGTEYHFAGADHKDPEVVWYDKDNCLCVQFHPEFGGWHTLAERYVKYIEEYLF